MNKNNVNNDKKVYSAAEVQKMLGMGRSRLYLLLDEVYRKQDPFRVLKFGKVYKIPKKSFDEWLDGYYAS